MEVKDKITVKDENGKRVDLEVIEALKVDNKEYVIVSIPGTEDAHAYRTEVKNGERDFISIGNGDEFKRVAEAYKEIHKND